MLVCCYETQSIYIFERTLLLETAGLIVAAGYGSGSTEIAITVGAVSHTAAFTPATDFSSLDVDEHNETAVTDGR